MSQGSIYIPDPDGNSDSPSAVNNAWNYGLL
jgi:hypothetical protein